MLKKPLYCVELQSIQYFLSITNWGSMTTTAEHLHVTQPLLSRRIHSLENELGVKLFLRKSRKLYLTPAGEMLKIRFADILNQIEDALEQAKKIEEKTKQRLAFGFSSSSLDHEFHRKIITQLRNSLTDHTLINKVYKITDIINAVYMGQVDLALFPCYVDIDQLSGLSNRLIDNVPLYAFMSVTHPLASHKTVKWTDLKNDYWVCMTSQNVNPFEKCMEKISAENGFVPKFTNADNSQDVVLAISLNESISICPKYNTFGVDIVGIQIEDAYVPYILAWKNTSASDLLHLVDKLELVIKDCLLAQCNSF